MYFNVVKQNQEVNGALRAAFGISGADEKRMPVNADMETVFGRRACYVAREIGVHPALVHGVILLFETTPHVPIADIHALTGRVRDRLQELSPAAALAMYRYNGAVPHNIFSRAPA